MLTPPRTRWLSLAGNRQEVAPVDGPDRDIAQRVAARCTPARRRASRRPTGSQTTCRRGARTTSRVTRPGSAWGRHGFGVMLLTGCRPNDRLSGIRVRPCQRCYLSVATARSSASAASAPSTSAGGTSPHTTPWMAAAAPSHSTRRMRGNNRPVELRPLEDHRCWAVRQQPIDAALTTPR